MKKIIPLLLTAFLTCLTAAAEELPVKQAITPFVESGDLAGIITVVADRENIIQLDAIGMANIETKTPMADDTVFWIASQAKPFTAVAVMMLAEEGILSLDASITAYLPELGELRVIAERTDEKTVLVPVATPITLRHLLSHTAGMAWITPIHTRFGVIDCMPLDQMVMTCAMTPLDRQPGTKYAYSNMGIEIAAAAVQRASGMPFEEFLQKRIFDPLGMKDTTFWPTEEQLARMAIVYGWDSEANKLAPIHTPQLTYPLTDRCRRHAAGGGGLFSTPRDMVRFYQMLLGEGEFRGKRLLKPESVREIAKKQTGDLPDGYGLGSVSGGDFFGHGGMCGTDSMVDVRRDRVFMFIIQEMGCPKPGEAKAAFFGVSRK